MERRNHSVDETGMMHKAYYCSEWDYCKPCRHIQHYEKFKVLNYSKKGDDQRQLI
jgi:hypothetical protein